MSPITVMVLAIAAWLIIYLTTWSYIRSRDREGDTA